MRYLGVLAADGLLFALAYAGAFMLRFDGLPAPHWVELCLHTLPLAVALKLVFFLLFRLHRQLWRFASTMDLIRIVEAAGLSACAEYFAIVLPRHQAYVSFPRAIVPLDAVLVVLLCGGSRLASRLWYHRSRHSTAITRVAIIGAGSAAEAALREIVHRPDLGYRAVFLVDVDPSQVGNSIHGVRIRGQVPDLPRLARSYPVDEFIIAMPTATRAQMQEVIDTIGPLGLPSRTIPAVSDLISGTVSVSRLRRVEIADLLNRDQVDIDPESVAAYLQGRCVMVTGAGGSIGTELCRQVLHVGPRQLLLFSRGENSLYEVHRRLTAEFPHATLVAIQGSVTDRQKLAAVMAEYRPEAVFHAAANKHVPLSEINIDETLLCNVVGTWNVIAAASRHGVRNVVCISTDKAVESRSVMGASKRIAEYLVLQADYPGLVCTAVRFGNVLGSRGSVVPLFAEQIAKGEPITVTDPRMTRYFMTIPEAARLVLQAGAFSRGGDLFILEMGEPLKIVDLARRMIMLSGLRPEEDIPIRVVGLRPGEKLHEALLNSEETFEATPHPKIRRVCCQLSVRVSEAEIEELRDRCAARDQEGLRSWVAARVPSLDGDASEPIGPVEEPRPG